MWMCSDFAAAKVYPHSFPFSWSTCSVAWWSFCPWAFSLYVVATRKSSIYVRMEVVALAVLGVEVFAMSLTLRRKSIGDSGDPCGVPLSVAKAFELFPLNR